MAKLDIKNVITSEKVRTDQPIGLWFASRYFRRLLLGQSDMHQLAIRAKTVMKVEF